MYRLSYVACLSVSHPAIELAPSGSFVLCASLMFFSMLSMTAELNPRRYPSWGGLTIALDMCLKCLVHGRNLAPVFETLPSLFCLREFGFAFAARGWIGRHGSGKSTGTYVHFDPVQDGAEGQTLVIRGPLLQVYRAHALLMRRYHETQAEAARIASIFWELQPGFVHGADGNCENCKCWGV